MEKKSKIRKKIIYVYSFLILIITISTIYVIIYIINSFSSRKQAKEESNLLNTIATKQNANLQVEETTIEQEEIAKEENQSMERKTERMIQVENLQKENSDVVGWIEIEDTGINYPVLQGTDNEYYMTHNYKKQKSRNGSIFLNKDYDWTIPSSNLLIYGHNLNNGVMFQELLKYEKESFYKKHPNIRFTTEKEDAEFEIISVFKSRVYYKSEKNVFRYYYFINAESEEEYNQFITNVKKASLYNIDATAQYNEQLITLSTCAYYVEDGRFVVVGRKKANDF